MPLKWNCLSVGDCSTAPLVYEKNTNWKKIVLDASIFVCFNNKIILLHGLFSRATCHLIRLIRSLSWNFYYFCFKKGNLIEFANEFASQRAKQIILLSQNESSFPIASYSLQLAVFSWDRGAKIELQREKSSVKIYQKKDLNLSKRKVINIFMCLNLIWLTKWQRDPL